MSSTAGGTQMTRYLAYASLVGLAASMMLPGGKLEAQQQDFSSVEIKTLQVTDNIHMLVGAGGNITVQVGDDGVLIVDTQFAPLSEKIAAAIAELSDLPIPLHRQYASSWRPHGRQREPEDRRKHGHRRQYAGPRALCGGRRAGDRARERVAALERDDRRAGRPIDAVADEYFFRRREEALFQRRRDPHHPPARGAHRWRRDRVFPPVGCHSSRRCLLDDQLSRARPERGCKLSGRDRRAWYDRRSHHPCLRAGRGHARDPGARQAVGASATCSIIGRWYSSSMAVCGN